MKQSVAKEVRQHVMLQDGNVVDRMRFDSVVKFIAQFKSTSPGLYMSLLKVVRHSPAGLKNRATLTHQLSKTGLLNANGELTEDAQQIINDVTDELGNISIQHCMLVK